MSERNHILFVYGTLKQHERNHHYLENAERIANHCWTDGRVFDTGQGYPAMVQDPENRVCGELYRVNDEELRRVDELEGYHGPGANNHYERVVQEVYLADERVFEGFVYVYL